MTAEPHLDLVVLDCPDALELGRFYAEVLGWEVEAGSDADWVTLAPPGGRDHASAGASRPAGHPFCLCAC